MKFGFHKRNLWGDEVLQAPVLRTYLNNPALHQPPHYRLNQLVASQRSEPQPRGYFRGQVTPLDFFMNGRFMRVFQTSAGKHVRMCDLNRQDKVFSYLAMYYRHSWQYFVNKLGTSALSSVKRKATCLACWHSTVPPKGHFGNILFWYVSEGVQGLLWRNKK